MFNRYFIISVFFSLSAVLSLNAARNGSVQPLSYSFDRPCGLYTEQSGAGLDFTDVPALGSMLSGRDKAVPSEPVYFSVKVPDGNYRVTVTLGSKRRAADTWVRAESRRHYSDEIVTKKNKFETFTFVVNKHNPQIDAKTKVKLKTQKRKRMM